MITIETIRRDTGLKCVLDCSRRAAFTLKFRSENGNGEPANAINLFLCPACMRALENIVKNRPHSIIERYKEVS